MLIVMKAQAAPGDITRVCDKIAALGFKAHIIPGEQRTAIGITGNTGPVEAAEFDDLPGVAEAIPVSKAYKLVSRETKPEDTVVEVHGCSVGGGGSLRFAPDPARSRAASRFWNRRMR